MHASTIILCTDRHAFALCLAEKLCRLGTHIVVNLVYAGCECLLVGGFSHGIEAVHAINHLLINVVPALVREDDTIGKMQLLPFL